MTPRPLALIILDGWGYRESATANAIAAAQTPVWHRLWQTYPHTTLSASGLDVGLPAGQMGNSEVGHLTMGAGRTIFQDLSRISQAITQGDFDQNPVLTETLNKVTQNQQALHVLGLLSAGGVHSHENHLHALLHLAAKKGVKNIFIHAFLDGRDTPPKSAKASLQALTHICQSLSATTHARIASISGRYYAMDRDQRWERTQMVYELLTENKARWYASSAIEALIHAYHRDESDEFVQPTIISPATSIETGDAVIFMNFRADRARQLSYALTDPQFSGFSRVKYPKLADFVTLTEYASDLKAKVAFPTLSIPNLLGEYLQNNHLTQLRLAETEKYAHVTFFLNGGKELPFENEKRILVPSKKVATYDLCPEMSAPELTEAFVKAIHEKSADLIICNYANADMVGHTGHFNASVKAIEILDQSLGKVIEALKVVNGEALITADHGNAEIMFDETTQQAHTAHTVERVPLIYVGRPFSITKHTGTLADVAPTLIALLGLPIPPEMTGTNLLTTPAYTEKS